MASKMMASVMATAKDQAQDDNGSASGSATIPMYQVSEASTELEMGSVETKGSSDATMSDKTSMQSLQSLDGSDVSPRGDKTTSGSPMSGSPSSIPIPRRERWSDLCEGGDDLDASSSLDEDLFWRQGELDDSPRSSAEGSPAKSPSKSARRANRRRRRREETKALLAAAAMVEQQSPTASVRAPEPQQFVHRPACSPSKPPGKLQGPPGNLAAPPGKLMLPVGAVRSSGSFAMASFGSCSPTCVASPCRPSSMASTSPISRTHRADPAGSPIRTGTGVACFMSAGQSVGYGDASTRTPTANPQGANASSFMRAGTMSSSGMTILSTDTAGRTPTASIRMVNNTGMVMAPMGNWGAQVPGGERQDAVPTATAPHFSTMPMPGMVNTSASPSPTQQPAQPRVDFSPAGSSPGSAAEALRTLLGPASNQMPLGEDLAARLRASAPEIYED